MRWLLKRSHSRARWPFWLLLGAWFCANSPQAVTYEIVVWLGNARSFSHQQRLTSEVAFILAGQPAAAALGGARTEPAQPPSVPMPTEVTLKKFDLFVAFSSELIPPKTLTFKSGVNLQRPPASPGRELPSEPPRAV